MGCATRGQWRRQNCAESSTVNEPLRCRFGWTLLGILFVLFGEGLEAAENCFPRGKSVTFIIPSRVGSADNLYGRMIKTVAEEAIGSQFNTRNTPGKGGIEGMKELYGARPSGRTLGMLNTADAIGAGLAGAVPFEVTQFALFGRIADTPRAVFVGKSAFAEGLKTIQDAVDVPKTLRWGITSPGNFFAAAMLDHFLGIEGKFMRIRGSARQAVRAARGGNVDLIVLEVQSAQAIFKDDIIPILALGPKAPKGRAFAKYEAPTMGHIAKDQDIERLLSVARITASGLIIAGPPHIPGIRRECVHGGFRKALLGPNLRALARSARKPIAPLDGKAATTLVRKAAQDATSFKSIWVDALKTLEN